MATKGSDGAPLRAHLEKDAEGIVPNPVAAARLAAEPPLPPLTVDVWAVFLALHLRRPQSEIGPMRLPWSEVEAFGRVTGASLPAWKVRAIFAVEEAFFAVRAEHEK